MPNEPQLSYPGQVVGSGGPMPEEGANEAGQAPLADERPEEEIRADELREERVEQEFGPSAHNSTAGDEKPHAGEHHSGN